MSLIRSDLWVMGFVRRHNDLGHLCVISRRGDPIAGQVWVEVDHLDGTVSLFVPAPSAARGDEGAGQVFECRFSRKDRASVAERIGREANFDPDFWVISLEMRGEDFGIEVLGSKET